MEKIKENLITWIQKWFGSNGNDCKAVIGLSGGKDSTIVCALMCQALGADRVIGVAMPDDNQGLNDADEIAKFFGINFIVAPIGDSVKTLAKYATTPQAVMNIPPRVRMTTLYAISQSNNGRVINTCNKSECFIGYETIFGDSAGDMSPLGGLTVRQVIALGHALGIPAKWVDKTPDDGLPNSSPDDEKFAKWGFSYALLDEYLENGFSGNMSADNAIMRQHILNKFKHEPMATFRP